VEADDWAAVGKSLGDSGRIPKGCWRDTGWSAPHQVALRGAGGTGIYVRSAR